MTQPDVINMNTFGGVPYGACYPPPLCASISESTNLQCVCGGGYCGLVADHNLQCRFNQANDLVLRKLFLKKQRKK